VWSLDASFRYARRALTDACIATVASAADCLSAERPRRSVASGERHRRPCWVACSGSHGRRIETIAFDGGCRIYRRTAIARPNASARSLCAERDRAVSAGLTIAPVAARLEAAPRRRAIVRIRVCRVGRPTIEFVNQHPRFASQRDTAFLAQGPRPGPARRARLRSRGPPSPLRPIVTSGTHEALKLSRALGNAVLIGDQQPQRRAAAAGPPNRPRGLQLAQQREHSVVAGAGLLGDRARAETRPSVGQHPLELVGRQRRARPLAAGPCPGGSATRRGRRSPGLLTRRRWNAELGGRRRTSGASGRGRWLGGR